MRATRLFAGAAAFWSAASALLIQTPSFLTAGPARINFTTEATDPSVASFNLVPEGGNSVSLADNVLLSAGFVDVNITETNGTYSVAAFDGITEKLFALSNEFLIQPAPVSTSASATTTSSSPGSTATSGADASKSSAPAAATNKPFPVVAIAGIILGILVLVSVILLFLLLNKRRRRDRRKTLLVGNTMFEAPEQLRRKSTIFSTMSWRKSQPPAPMTAASVPAMPVTSVTAAAARAAERQQRINTEIRMMKKQMKSESDSEARELKVADSPVFPNPHSPFPNPTSPFQNPHSPFPNPTSGFPNPYSPDGELSPKLDDESLDYQIVHLQLPLSYTKTG